MQRAASSEPALAGHRRGRVTVHLNPDAAQALDLDALFALPETLAGLPGGTSRQKRRTTWWRWQPAWSSVPLLVRQYAHGGALGPLLGTLFGGASRMLSELRTASYAHRAGVPTPRPLAVRIERVRGPFVSAYFVGELLTDARDLLALCELAASGQAPAPAARRAIAVSAGATVARMHEAGIEHADLNLRNILVSRPFDEPKAWVIDFDRARIRDVVQPRQRIGNLRRLDRSVRKRPVSDVTVGLLDRLRMLRSYAHHCQGWEPEWRALLSSGGR